MNYVAFAYIACVAINAFPGMRTFQGGERPKVNWSNPAPWLNLLSFACALTLAIYVLAT